MSVIPPSSPRLPSPPPPAENQIGNSSPSGGAEATLHTLEMEQSQLDASSRRRIHPGTKSEDMAAGPPLIPLNELDSAFQLQEHLAALHYHHTASRTQALTRDTAVQLAQPPVGIDRTLWLYELCRFLISQCNSLIVGFLFDAPPCSASTCPEMRASEWQFLCAVHEQPKSCCAIDYCCHTLDWAANVVTDQKIFPSRFAILGDPQTKSAGSKNLVNVFRRLHRIFAHAWFQHRSIFWSVEGQTGLYVFFKTVCDLYDLLPAENYKLPPEAEGIDAPPLEAEERAPVPQILKPPSQQQQQQHSRGPVSSTVDNDDSLLPVGRTNTRRHIRSSPSTGSAVTTVLEADEEEGEILAKRMRNMRVTNDPVDLDVSNEENTQQSQQQPSSEPEAVPETKEEVPDSTDSAPVAPLAETGHQETDQNTLAATQESGTEAPSDTPPVEPTPSTTLETEGVPPETGEESTTKPHNLTQDEANTEKDTMGSHAVQEDPPNNTSDPTSAAETDSVKPE